MEVTIEDLIVKENLKELFIKMGLDKKIIEHNAFNAFINYFYQILRAPDTYGHFPPSFKVEVSDDKILIKSPGNNEIENLKTLILSVNKSGVIIDTIEYHFTEKNTDKSIMKNRYVCRLNSLNELYFITTKASTYIDSRTSTIKDYIVTSENVYNKGGIEIEQWHHIAENTRELGEDKKVQPLTYEDYQELSESHMNENAEHIHFMRYFIDVAYVTHEIGVNSTPAKCFCPLGTIDGLQSMEPLYKFDPSAKAYSVAPIDSYEYDELIKSQNSKAVQLALKAYNKDARIDFEWKDARFKELVKKKND